MKKNILVVTDLASRGLDVPSVVTTFNQGWVIQYDFPPKPKIFIHRSGRTARAGLTGKTVSFLATNETMYALDLLLYIGRKMTFDNNFENFGTKVRFYRKAYCGEIPFDQLSSYQEQFLKDLEDPELFKSYDTAEKAFTQFIKTRPSASKSSSQQSKLMPANPFPLIQAVLPKANLLLDQLSTFKPRESFLDLKHSGKLHGEKNEVFLENKRKIENQQKKKLRLLENEDNYWGQGSFLTEVFLF